MTRELLNKEKKFFDVLNIKYHDLQNIVFKNECGEFVTDLYFDADFFTWKVSRWFKRNNIFSLKEILNFDFDKFINNSRMSIKKTEYILEKLKSVTYIKKSANFYKYDFVNLEDTKKTIVNFIFNNVIDKNKLFFVNKNFLIKEDCFLEEINLPSNLINLLHKNNINTVKELVFLSYDDFIKIKQSGKSKNKIIFNALKNALFLYDIDYYDLNDYNYVFDLLSQFNKNILLFNKKILTLIILKKIDKQHWNSQILEHINELLNDDFEWISYLEMAILNLLSITENKIKVVLLEKIIQENNYLFEKALNNLILKNKLALINDHYFIKNLTIEEYIKTIDDDNTREIVFNRIDNWSLEEIGIKFKLSRERVRQKIIFLQDLNLWEDYFKSYFEKYDWNKEALRKIFNLSSYSYNYLKQKYKKGTEHIFNFFYEEDISKDIRKRAFEYNHEYGIYSDGKFILKKRKNILEHLLKVFCSKKEYMLDEFKQKYFEFLNNHKIINDSDFVFNERYFESAIANSYNVIWKYKKRFRYYDISAINIDELLHDINFFSFNNLEIATDIFFKNYSDILIDKWDIRDEYELHNILKKRMADDPVYNDKVTFLRMPNISIGKANRQEQVKKLLFTFSPILITDFAKKYQELYGVKTQNVISNYLEFIKEYIDGNFLDIPYQTLNDEEIQLFKKNLCKPYYTYDEITSEFTSIFPLKNTNYINAYNLKKLGFNLASKIIYKNEFSSVSSLFKSLFNKLEFFEKKDFINVANYGSFINICEELKSNFEIIQYKKNQYMNYSTFYEKYKISKSLIEDFIYKCIEFSQREYFTIHSLIKNGFYHELFKFQFDEYFYISLLKTNKRFKFINLVSEKCVFKRSTNPYSFVDFIESLIDKKSKIYLNDFLKMLEEVYGLLIEKYKVIVAFREMNAFYCSTTERIYFDYDEYCNE